MIRRQPRHRRETPFDDRRLDRFRNLHPADYSRAKHRKIGPPDRMTIFDMSPDELTEAKGLGGRT